MAPSAVLWALALAMQAWVGSDKLELVKICMFSAVLATRILQLQNTTTTTFSFLRILVTREDWVESKEQNTIIFMKPIQESLDAFN